ncbi:MAG: FKBP-type peptidyl-prolyl cis-trans isomerase [Caulobacteraceae bacterium]
MRLSMIGLLGAAALLASCGGAGAQTAANNAQSGAAFLAQNALTPGVKTLPSGIQYQVVKSGPAGGVHPTLADKITIHYEAVLLSGQVVDSSFERGEPATFPLGGLVPAWQEIVPLMVPGDEWVLWSPPKLAYGEAGAGPIPPNAVLKFRIQLIKVGE